MTDKAIICVDDEMIILLSIVQEIKKAFGTRFVYEQALSAESALNIVDELTGEGMRDILIISDWLMPGMKGDQFLEIVKAKYPAIKAIIITGQADRNAIERIKSNSSVVAVLSKPWSRTELTETIAACTSIE